MADDPEAPESVGGTEQPAPAEDAPEGPVGNLAKLLIDLKTRIDALEAEAKADPISAEGLAKIHQVATELGPHVDELEKRLGAIEAWLKKL